MGDTFFTRILPLNHKVSVGIDRQGRRHTIYVRRSKSKPYPASSSREAMRNARRAQGGPGIVQQANGMWVARQEGGAA